MTKRSDKNGRNKEKAWSNICISLTIENAIWLLILFAILTIAKWFIQLQELDYLYFLVLANWIWGFLRNRLWINSIKYYYSEDKLIAEYKIITRTKDSARLQVVNSVDITQGIINKLFGLFKITVNYGFTADGYEFGFEYLDGEVAEKVFKNIKAIGLKIEDKNTD